MEYRPFGQTDLQVSAIGFGCWEIGGTYGKIEEAQFQQAVQRAIDAGINCFDTAEAYGMGASEQALARALGARRKEVCYGDQIRRRLRRGRPAARQQPTARHGLDRKSLRHLQTDYVDVYLVHWPDVHTPFEETMRALDDIVRQGKARYIGVSNFRLAQLEACMRLRRIDVVQYGWNMFDRRMQAEIFPYCARAADRCHGLWVAGLWHAQRHLPRRHAVRGERLALARRQASAASTCSGRCSARALSPQPAWRWRNSSAWRPKYQQDPAAIRAALDHEQPGRSASALVGLSPGRRGGRKTSGRWAGSISDADMAADRRHPRPP